MSGGAADLRRVDPALLHPADRLVLNDVDPDALQHALTHLPPATRVQTAAAPGNVLRTAAHLAADHGPFDLVLAGGLFDYLERFAGALIPPPCPACAAPEARSASPTSRPRTRTPP
ncbi:hypothetical protein OR263_07425 [Streptomyces sp. NEAU-H22]|uniref:hypothetical protein n=1 Tax=unclassified Streptomyces TaxID=2593676 RepID=UPI00225BCBCD|nr:MULTISPECIES: hypothetical protein [unclassified Streptomyces]MCX3286542.1 hypothetical protein [Streptomyces sp. NEAU-H22]WMD09595.1 hypothetical protein Q7C01_36830 [Streptomyces sp. FXY-T5]